MTTEIAVINRLGIALAADSAVTISGFSVQKVFDSGDKLFELSCNDPIAAMVNGNLHFLGVPWELLIKEFRDLDRPAPPATVEAWANSFLAFVRAHKAVNGRMTTEWMSRFAGAESDRVYSEVVERYRAAVEADDPRAKEGDFVAFIFKAVIAEWLATITKQPRLDSLSKLSDRELDDAVRPVIRSELAARLGRELEVEVLDPLAEYVERRMLCTLDSGSPTGLVVCGFAGDDLFPSLNAVMMDGVVAGHLRYRVTHNVEITRDTEPEAGKLKELGTAISFAQTDVINRLLRGADDRFVNGTNEFIIDVVSKSVVDLFERFKLKIVNDTGGEIDASKFAELLAYTIADEYHEHANSMGDEIETAFKQTIALMPKQELIELAEALVSITAVERKATNDDMGTVGGPIDVALITRSEGFVWVKRKHHFKAELNPRYISRLAQRLGSGEKA